MLHPDLEVDGGCNRLEFRRLPTDGRYFVVFGIVTSRPLLYLSDLYTRKLQIYTYIFIYIVSSWDCTDSYHQSSDANQGWCFDGYCSRWPVPPPVASSLNFAFLATPVSLALIDEPVVDLLQIQAAELLQGCFLQLLCTINHSSVGTNRGRNYNARPCNATYRHSWLQQSIVLEHN